MDAATVRELARLARLDLEPEEIQRAAGQLGRLLAWFDLLREVDTTGVEGSPYPRDLPLRARPDQPGPVLPTDEVLAGAAQRRAEQFVVPRVVDA